MSTQRKVFGYALLIVTIVVLAWWGNKITATSDAKVIGCWSEPNPAMPSGWETVCGDLRLAPAGAVLQTKGR